MTIDEEAGLSSYSDLFRDKLQNDLDSKEKCE
jgi:hypothetical protein